MPFSEEHKRKKAKNFALLALLLALIATLFAISIIRMSSGT